MKQREREREREREDQGQLFEAAVREKKASRKTHLQHQTTQKQPTSHIPRPPNPRLTQVLPHQQHRRRSNRMTVITRRPNDSYDSQQTQLGCSRPGFGVWESSPAGETSGEVLLHEHEFGDGVLG